jgi:choline transporter-like protein 2/4/5
MGCCGPTDDTPWTYEKMNKNRKCTDVIFLLAYLAFMVGMAIVGILGFSEGDPAALLFGTDYEGELCTDDYPTRYFPNPYELILAKDATHAYGFKDVKSICVKDCPSPTGTTNAPLNWVCNYPDSSDGRGNTAMTRAEWAAADYDYFASLNATFKTDSYNNKGPCYPVLLHTVNTYETCTFYGTQDTKAYNYLTNSVTLSQPEHNLTTFVPALSTFVADQIAGPSAIMARYIDDFAQAWVVCLVMGFIAPFLLSFVWMGVLRYFTGLFAYLIILMTNVGAIGITLYLYMKAGIIGGDEISAYAGDSAADSATNYVDPSEENQEVLGYCAHFSAVLAVLLLIFTLIMLKRVAIAVAVIKVATQAITAAPSVVFFPIAPVLLAFGFGAYWLAAAVYIYSSGENVLRSCDLSDASLAPKKYCASPNDPLNCHCGYETEMDENMQYMLMYHLFGLLWTTQFLQAITYLTLASVFATFYFGGGSYGNSLSGWLNTPALQSFRKMTWFHSGSAAFGSFLVALLQFIRIVVAYMVHQMKKAGKDNIVVKYAACVIQYCLWYLQKIIEWINRNTYIMIAIEGKSFCWSAWEALSLIFNNILTVGAVNIIGDMLLFLGKFSVAAVAGLLAFLMLDSDTYTTGDSKVSSPLLVVIFCVVFGFIIASLFMSVVEMAIDTTLLAFCKDCKIHGGKPKFAPPLLESVLGKAKDKNAKKSGEDTA